MSDPERLRREVDDLERKLKRLIADIESGNQDDLEAVVFILRKLLRDHVEDIERLARDLN